MEGISIEVIANKSGKMIPVMECKMADFRDDKGQLSKRTIECLTSFIEYTVKQNNHTLIIKNWGIEGSMSMSESTYWVLTQGELGCKQCVHWNGVKNNKPCEYFDEEMEGAEEEKECGKREV